MIKAWSKTLSTLALSTGEAELGAVVKGLTEAEGIVSLLVDFGIGLKIRLRSDASAAIGIAQRAGLGKVRHLAVSDLWIQQRIKHGGVGIEKLCGDVNPSDLMTKGLDGPRITKLLKLMGLIVPVSEGTVEVDKTVLNTHGEKHTYEHDWRSRERGGVKE